MNRLNAGCDPTQLEKAIGEELDNAAEALLEKHLSNCASCREQLSRLAGDESFWQMATANLAASGEIPAQPKTELHSSIFVKIDAAAPDRVAFLDSSEMPHELDVPFSSPTHPEMLGRVDGFSIEQIIGRGGMGVVYKGFDAELNRPVAIKFLAPHLSVSGVARKRFAREAQAAAAVVHPNVVPIYSIGSSKNRPYIVMALVSGRSLQKHVDDHGPLEAEEVVRIAQQIAAGLSAAHEQGLVHRDIKPANILLEKEVSRVLITDFGLARAADDAGVTQSGWLAGTPHYMSPEQTKGDDVDHRSDLFSLGSVMYFMATGREPFRAENPYAVLQKIGSGTPDSIRSINSRIPKPLDELILKLLARDPESRFGSANESQEVLTQLLAHLQNPTQHARPKFDKVSKDDRTLIRPIGIAMAAAVLVLAIYSGIMLTMFFLNKGETQHSDNAAAGFSNAYRATVAQPTSKVLTENSHWAAELPGVESWNQEMAELRRQVEQMETRQGSSSTANDLFESEKSSLEQQLRAMESSFGLQP